MPPNELSTVGDGTPSWMLALANTGDDSLASIQEYRSIPFIKIVQPMTDPAVKKEAGGEGAILINPGGIRLAKPEESFYGTPIFFFTEFTKWSDLKDESSPTILERTYDPTSELAAKCRDKEKWKEPVKGTPFETRNSEVMNYVIKIRGGDNEGNMAVLRFLRGEFKVGKLFANSLLMRRIGNNPAPMWMNIFGFRSVLRPKKNGNQWWGIQPFNPAEGPPFILDQDEAKKCQSGYLALKADFEARRIRTDYDDEQEVEDETTAKM